MMTTLIRLICALLLVAVSCVHLVMAQSGNATLYSPLKYKNEKRDFCLNFKTGVSAKHADPCDLRYGMLYAGDEWDWLQSSAHQGSRSVIKDLGPRSWDVAFSVPFVLPLPKLLPGERRKVSIDTSGADGADGMPGADADGVIRQPIPTNKNKRDGKPKVDPLYVKAIVGHMYVIRVIDNNKDFYALFRVEAVKRGDHCLISWRLVDAPPEEGPIGLEVNETEWFRL